LPGSQRSPRGEPRSQRRGRQALTLAFFRSALRREETASNCSSTPCGESTLALSHHRLRTFDTASNDQARPRKDYLPKPFTPAQIRPLVEQLAREQRELNFAGVLDLEAATARGGFPEVDLGRPTAPKMRAVLDMLATRGEVGWQRSYCVRSGCWARGCCPHLALPRAPVLLGRSLVVELPNPSPRSC